VAPSASLLNSISLLTLIFARQNPQPLVTSSLIHYSFPLDLEVQIQGTQPITFQQAFDLALRNNRELQVEQLNLAVEPLCEKSLAAEFPTLRLGVDVANQEEMFLVIRVINYFTGTASQTTGGAVTGQTTGALPVRRLGL